MLKAEDIREMTLLDVGGGVGAIQHELLSAGASSAINAEASAAYIDAAREEAERQGHVDRVSFRYGDFVELALDVAPADIVTLDRVICCYHDMQRLVGLSSSLARKYYGVVYPRDTWWMKIGFAIINLGLWVRRSPFRIFLHPSEAVDAVVRRHGLERRFYGKTAFWHVVVYARQDRDMASIGNTMA